MTAVQAQQQQLQQGTTATTTTTTKSKLSLYVSRQLGSVESTTDARMLQEMLSLSDSRTLKIAKNMPGPASASKYLSQFSNACDRLGMSPVEAESAWQVFCKVYRELCTTKPRAISAAEAAFYSISCYCITADEYEAVSVVSSLFGTKQACMRDLYHLRIVVSTRVDGLPPLAGGRMRLTMSSMWMRGSIARRFFLNNNSSMLKQYQRQQPALRQACAMRARVAPRRMGRKSSISSGR